jgi:hypothetical protein
MSDAVLFDAREDGIAIITINRPEQRNALIPEVREACARRGTASSVTRSFGSPSSPARARRPSAPAAT